MSNTNQPGTTPAASKTLAETAVQPTCRMTVDFNVLDHSGLNLYSNIAAVLTEAVANAWDADADTVSISVDPEGQWIEIIDDGIGSSSRRRAGR